MHQGLALDPPSTLLIPGRLQEHIGWLQTANSIEQSQATSWNCSYEYAGNTYSVLANKADS